MGFILKLALEVDITSSLYCVLFQAISKLWDSLVYWSAFMKYILIWPAPHGIKKRENAAQ